MKKKFLMIAGALAILALTLVNVNVTFNTNGSSNILLSTLKIAMADDEQGGGGGNGGGDFHYKWLNYCYYCIPWPGQSGHRINCVLNYDQGDWYCYATPCTYGTCM
jgi:hypothetical protein